MCQGLKNNYMSCSSSVKGAGEKEERKGEKKEGRERKEKRRKKEEKWKTDKGQERKEKKGRELQLSLSQSCRRATREPLGLKISHQETCCHMHA